MAATSEVMAPEANGGSLNMMRIDLQDSLRKSTVDPRELSSFQRILLTTDGTVTEILEAQLWEAIHIRKLYEDTVAIECPVPYLEIEPGTEVILRKVVLRGRVSHKNYIYAESITVLDRLDDRLKEGMLTTQKPLGLLMIENRLETFREIMNCQLETAAELAEHYGVAPEDQLISRTYRVYANRQPFMLITEKFPASYFRE